MKQVTKELQGMPYVNVTLMDGNGNPIARNPNATGMTFGTSDGVEQALIEVYPEAIAAQARSIVSTKLRTRIYEDNGGYNVYCNYNFPGEDRPEVLDIEHRLLEIDVQQHEGVTQNPLQIHLSFIPMGTGSANTCTFSEPTVFVEHIIDVTEQETATSLPTPMGVSAEVLPATGKVIAAFSDTEALATPLGISVSHVFNPDESNALNAYGKGFRLNVDERMVLCSEFKPSTDEEKTLNSFDYIYTDGKGRSHGFEEYFFYTTESEARNYIPEAEIGKITVDSYGDMIYEKNFKLYKVMRELRSATGWEASTRLKGVKNLALLEQRTDDEKQLEEQIEDYTATLAEYAIINTETGEIREEIATTSWGEYEALNIAENEMLLPTSEAYNYQSLLMQKSALSSQTASALLQKKSLEAQKANLENQKASLHAQKESLIAQRETLKVNYDALSNQTLYSERMRSYYVKTASEEAKAAGPNWTFHTVGMISDTDVNENWLSSLELANTNASLSITERNRELLGEENGTENKVADNTAYTQMKLIKEQLCSIEAQIKNVDDMIALITSEDENENDQTKQAEADADLLEEQLAFNETQCKKILARKSKYVADFEELLITYEQLVANLAHLRLSLPVSYLSKDGVVKGFNEKGDLCIIFDNNENYLAFERTDKGLVERLYDKDENAITFTYEDERLLRITDAFGNSVKYTYTSNGMLEAASFSGGKELSFSYETESLLAEIKSTAASAEDSASDFTKVQLSYTYDKLTRAELFSLVDSIPFDLADANKSILLSSVTLTYAIVHGSDTTTLTDERGDVTRYYFDEHGTPCSYVTEENGLVTRAEHHEREYHDVDVSHGVKMLPRVERIFYAKESTLYKKPLSEFVFEMGERHILTRNDLGEVETETRTWESAANGNTYQHESVSTYTYGDEHRPIRKRTVTTKKNADGTILSTDITVCEYFYNTSGKLIRTESYTEGKKELLGVSVSETVYDENGNVKRSFSYNTLSPSDKTYTESETDAKGYKLFDLDATGKHKTSYTYFADGSLASEQYPNGGTLAYAYDKEGNTVSVTASTAEGEGNTNVTHYTAGLVTRVESGNHVVEYEYDGKRRLTKVKLDGRDYESHAYTDHADGTETITTYFNNTEDIVIKNAKGDVIQFNLDCMSEFHYEYEPDGRIKKRRDQYSGREYAYDYTAKKLLEKYTDSYGVEETMTYDDKGRLSTKKDKSAIFASGSPETTLEYAYSYDEERDRVSQMRVAGYNINPSYDALGRSTGKSIAIRTAVKASEKITYLKQGDHTTDLPSVLKLKNATEETRIKYSYDEMGNIVKIAEDGIVSSRYEYDALGRLTREDNRAFGKTSLWEYDENGNILSRREYAFSVKPTEELTENDPVNVVEYKYDGDRLISYNGDTGFSYDTNKMPIKYRGKDASFVGRVLYGYGEQGLSYDGNTLPRSIGGIMPSYDENSNITSDNYFHYIYSYDGALLGCLDKTNGAKYFYQCDTQGNIVAMLDSVGNVVVRYKYDAWGLCKVLNPNGTENTSATFVGNKNPFRYRGYYYCCDLGFYYLKSRFYDPEVGRFISPDTIDYLAPDVINGLNLYAYCNNNPVMNSDPDGHWSWSAFWKGVGMVAVGVAAVAVSVATFGTAAPAAIAAVAAVTATAGTLTTVNGAATIVEAATDYNIVRDGVFQGNEAAYNAYANVTQSIASIGSAVLGVYNASGYAQATRAGKQYLGEGFTKYKKGIWRSKDGFRQMRLDKGHVNIELFARPLAPKVKNITMMNAHIHYKGFRTWTEVGGKAWFLF